MTTSTIFWKLSWCLVLTRLANATAARQTAMAYDSCQKILNQVIETKSFLHYNLTEVDILLAGLSDTVKATTEGHSGGGDMQLERQIYATLAQNPCVTTICEIGFNGGHSAVGWLAANPTANVIMFDIWSHPYAAVGETYIRNKLLQLHPERMTIIKGSSLNTVRDYHTQHPLVTCDVISVDGGHTYDIAVKDIHNMRFLANKHFNVLLVDDTNCDAFFCVDTVLQEHQRRGNIEILEGFAIDRNRGVSVMKYIFPSFEKFMKTKG